MRTILISLAAILLTTGCGLGPDHESETKQIETQDRDTAPLPQFACRQLIRELAKDSGIEQRYAQLTDFPQTPETSPELEDQYCRINNSEFSGLDEVCACKESIHQRNIYATCYKPSDNEPIPEPTYWQYEKKNYSKWLLERSLKEFEGQREEFEEHFECFLDLLPSAGLAMDFYGRNLADRISINRRFEDGSLDPLQNCKHKTHYLPIWEKHFKKGMLFQCSASLARVEDPTDNELLLPERKPLLERDYRGFFSHLDFDQKQTGIGDDFSTARRRGLRASFHSLLWQNGQIKAPSNFNRRDLFLSDWLLKTRSDLGLLSTTESYPYKNLYPEAAEALQWEKRFFSGFGLAGMYSPPSRFEQQWLQAFGQLQYDMHGCGLKIFGDQPDQYSEFKKICIKEGFEITFVHRELLGNLYRFALLSLELSSIAHVEGDQSSANDLLSLSIEILKIAADISLGLSPAGRAKDLVEAISGRSTIPNFDYLTSTDRFIAAIGFVTAGSGTVKVLSKLLPKSSLIKSSWNFFDAAENVVEDVFKYTQSAVAKISRSFGIRKQDNLQDLFEIYNRPYRDIPDLPCSVVSSSPGWLNLMDRLLLIGTAIAAEKPPCLLENFDGIADWLIESASKIERFSPVKPGPLDEIPTGFGATVAGTFRSSSYFEITTKVQTKLYRVYGGNAQLSRYWSRIKPSGPLQATIDSALHPSFGNSAKKWVEITTPPGTKLYEGVVAGIEDIPGGISILGGGSQVYIHDIKIPDSWITDGGAF